MQLEPAQVRAARALLNWSSKDLAERVGMSVNAINMIETGKTRPLSSNIAAIIEAFTAAGIEFLPNSGVAKRDDTLRIIRTGDPYLQMLDDVFHTLKHGDEVLFSFVRNRLSSEAVIASDLRLRHAGLTFRTLIEEGDDFCLYPVREYRCIPSIHFQNNTQLIYGDKVGSMIDGNRMALIINNADFAQTQRKVFNLIWATHKAPTASSAPVTHG